ncbi:uncharacterized protein MICPUCDRAFT_37117 [Micromonas pusilla CCMP1545]|uniref:Ribulose bisphosphate carboxylase small subunit, chloroplastic n=1 Tax=Micromonas pusilla (strain CCMP1545) TaxID=564608 RepID=C1N9I3_MICPC|nr:uncharacterized protein MICPUCDRAFT_37117 [Micromonas pusilla CCMP1545]EEH51529.1 predicted protein [Micromonas pusilla CCMP1545]|eukprot:XP_003064624.1 predicted protein [Micromonas pusilla CCMP1545]
MAALCSVAPVVAKVPAVSTGKASKSSAMQVWNPTNNKFFETFSFLPPLSDQEIARQVQYLINNGWAPCIEFEGAGKAYCDTHGWSGLDSSVNAGYYDNRYWVMWKLPMYGCTSPDEVLAEVRACTRAFPDCFIRVAGFDNIKQVQCSSFLAHRPANDRTFQPVTGRQVGDGSDGRAAPAAPSGGGDSGMSGGFTPKPPQQNYSW